MLLVSDAKILCDPYQVSQKGEVNALSDLTYLLINLCSVNLGFHRVTKILFADSKIKITWTKFHHYWCYLDGISIQRACICTSQVSEKQNLLQIQLEWMGCHTSKNSDNVKEDIINIHTIYVDILKILVLFRPCWFGQDFLKELVRWVLLISNCINRIEFHWDWIHVMLRVVTDSLPIN